MPITETVDRCKRHDRRSFSSELKSEIIERFRFDDRSDSPGGQGLGRNPVGVSQVLCIEVTLEERKGLIPLEEGDSDVRARVDVHRLLP